MLQTQVVREPHDCPQTTGGHLIRNTPTKHGSAPAIFITTHTSPCLVTSMYTNKQNRSTNKFSCHLAFPHAPANTLSQLHSPVAMFSVKALLFRLPLLLRRCSPSLPMAFSPFGEGGVVPVEAVGEPGGKLNRWEVWRREYDGLDVGMAAACSMTDIGMQWKGKWQ